MNVTLNEAYSNVNSLNPYLVIWAENHGATEARGLEILTPQGYETEVTYYSESLHCKRIKLFIQLPTPPEAINEVPPIVSMY